MTATASASFRQSTSVAPGAKARLMPPPAVEELCTRLLGDNPKGDPCRPT